MRGPALSEELLAREIAGSRRSSTGCTSSLASRPPRPNSSRARGTSAGKLGHEGGLVERDAMVFQAAKRIAQLDAAHEGLVFGRLDLRAELDTEPRYVGRIGLRDDEPRLAADRLARARRRGVLPGHRRRAAARRTPPGAAQRRPDRGQRRGRAARRRRPRADLPIVGEGALMAQLSAGPRPVDALDRRHHPGRAGPRDPRARPGAWCRSPAGRAPARRSSRCTARRTCSTPTGAATRRAACWSSGPAACSCATSSGCCLARRDRGGPAVAGRGRRRASARPATTSRRSPTSRARPGWPS